MYNFQRGRTCLDHSILDQSSVPRNINEYIVNSHILPTPEDILGRFDIINGESITDNKFAHSDYDIKLPKTINIPFPIKEELDAKMKDMLKDTIRNDVSGILCNISSHRESISMKVTTKRYLHYCNNSSYHPNVLRSDNQNVFTTININGSSISENNISTHVKCNKSEIHKTVLKHGRCIYSIRIGNALKVCKRIQCRSGKKSKNLKQTDINLHGETVSPWLVQHFVDAL